MQFLNLLFNNRTNKSLFLFVQIKDMNMGISLPPPGNMTLLEGPDTSLVLNMSVVMLVYILPFPISIWRSSEENLNILKFFQLLSNTVASNKHPHPSLWKVMILINARAIIRIFTVIIQISKSKITCSSAVWSEPMLLINIFYIFNNSNYFFSFSTFSSKHPKDLLLLLFFYILIYGIQWFIVFFLYFSPIVLTLKAPRKPASENVVCLCRLLNILANFSNLFLHTGKQCGPRKEQSDLGPHCLQKWLLK